MQALRRLARRTRNNMVKLELSQSEVAAVENYIWQHVRTSPNGKAYKVWERMFEFQSSPEPVAEPERAELFELWK